MNVWITLFEILGLIFGLIGGGLTFLNLSDSRRDRPVVEQLHHDPAVHHGYWQMIALAAKGREESQRMRLAICGLITVSGLFGVIQRNPLGGCTLTALAAALALAGISVLTAHRSWRDYRQRHQMRELAMGRTSVIAAKLKADNPTPSKETP